MLGLVVLHVGRAGVPAPHGYLEVTGLGEVLSTRRVRHRPGVSGCRMCRSRPTRLRGTRPISSNTERLSRIECKRVGHSGRARGVCLRDRTSHSVVLPTEIDPCCTLHHNRHR